MATKEKQNNFIRSLRKKTSISRDSLSRMTGISYKTLQRYEEKDNPKMSLGNFLLVVNALGFELEINPIYKIKEAAKNENTRSIHKNKSSAKLGVKTKTSKR